MLRSTLLPISLKLSNFLLNASIFSVTGISSVKETSVLKGGIQSLKYYLRLLRRGIILP